MEPADLVEVEEEVTAAGEGEQEAHSQAVLMEKDLIQQSLANYQASHYSQLLLREHELLMDVQVLYLLEGLKGLQLSHQQLQAPGDGTQNAEDIFFRHVRESMGQDRAQFSMGTHAYLWADKYRLQMEQIHQMHYDMDNPSPRSYRATNSTTSTSVSTPRPSTSWRPARTTQILPTALPRSPALQGHHL